MGGMKGGRSGGACRTSTAELSPFFSNSSAVHSICSPPPAHSQCQSSGSGLQQQRREQGFGPAQAASVWLAGGTTCWRANTPSTGLDAATTAISRATKAPRMRL